MIPIKVSQTADRCHLLGLGEKFRLLLGPQIEGDSRCKWQLIYTKPGTDTLANETSIKVKMLFTMTLAKFELGLAPI